MFCTSCGKQIPDGSPFCEYCGAKQEAEPAPAPQGAQPMQSAPTGAAPVSFGAPPMGMAAPVEKKPMSTGTKVALILLAVLAAAYFGGREVLKSMYDPAKTINKFVEAISAQDGEALRSVTKVYQDEIELSDEALKPFFEAFSKNNNSLTEFRDVLNDDLRELNAGTIATGDGFLCLKKTDHWLYSSYDIEITPLTVSLVSEFDGAVITLGGANYTTGERPVSATLMPGKYSGSAKCTVPATGVELNTDFEVALLPYQNSYRYDSDTPWNEYLYYDRSSQKLTVNYAYTSVYLEASQELTQLEEILIDGTAYDLNSIDGSIYYGFYIGPLTYNNEITVKTNTCGFEQTNTFNTADTTYYYIEFELPEEAQNEGVALASEILPDAISAYYSYDQAALNRLNAAANAGKLSEESMSSLRSRVEDWITRANNATYSYSRTVYTDAQVTETPSVSNIRYSSDGITMQTRLRGSATAQYFPDWTTAEGANEPYQATFSITVYLRYADGRWTVTNTSW